MRIRLVIFIQVLVVFTCLNLGFTADITPSHVYQQVGIIIAEIDLIRNNKGVTEKARNPGKQINKDPLHVFSKGLELLEKIAQYETELKMDPVVVPDIPLMKVTPSEVFSLTQIILTELRKIKVQLGINKNIKIPAFEGGKVPANVYESIWQASFMMDGLTNSITPNLVYRNVQYMIADLEIIASDLGVVLKPVSISEIKDKKPMDVLLENYVSMYTLARLERALKLNVFFVPPIPGGKITPSNAYDTTNMILAELARIKVELKISKRYDKIAVPSRKTPTDVYKLTRIFQGYLTQILQSIKS